MSSFLGRPRARRFYRRLVALAVAVGPASLLAACGAILPSHAPKSPTPAESLLAFSALQEVVDQFIRHEQAERFELRVQVGATRDRMPEFSERTAREDARFARSLIRRLDWISVDALNESDYLTLLTVRTELQGASDQALYYANDLTPFGAASPLAQITRMMSELSLRDARDIERYERLLNSVAPFADTLEAELIRRGAQGIFLGQSAVARAEGFFASFETPSSRSTLRLTPERAKALDSLTAERLIAVTDSAIDGRIAPAFKRLTRFLAGEYGRKGPVGIGLWQYVGGNEYYRALVRRWTTLDVTPQQAHEAGLREVARLDTAMRALRLRMGESAVADSFHAAIRSDARFRDVTRDGIVDQLLQAQASLAMSSDTGSASPGLFPVVLAAATELDTRDRILGWYHQPRGADSVGQYTPGKALLTPALPVMVEALSYFALSPGRHELLGRRLERSLAVARWYASVPAYTDGWGLYALDLARERGALTDPFAAYGALMLEMIAAVRLTVDVGIHYFGWSAGQATKFFLRYTMLGEAEVENEVTRIAHDAPGMGLAAAMGAREIRGVRRWMERELKKDFDEGRFNNELRSLGPIPLQALGSHFEWWLWKEQTRIRAAVDEAKASEKSAKRGSNGREYDAWQFASRRNMDYGTDV
jgi:uncharacterized protein (DUF885 family)